MNDSNFEQKTFKIFEHSISIIKDAGKDALVEKWERILRNCRDKSPSEQEEESCE